MELNSETRGGRAEGGWGGRQMAIVSLKNSTMRQIGKLLYIKNS